MSELRFTPEDRTAGPAAGSGRRRNARKSAKAAKTASGGRSGRSRSAGRGARRRPGIVRRLVGFGLVDCLWAAIGLSAFVGWHAMTLPPPEELSVPERPANIMILAADGSTLANRGETGGEEVRLFELPRHLPRAVIAIEDRRFYDHFGIDPVGVARALVENMTAGGVVQGGSTLTQQLAKNLFLKPERTMRRKVQELLLAFWLEYNYSKDEILEMYLNRVYLGAGATGVEAAAQVYYGKSARDVTLAESAVIAGLLQAPSRLAPTRDPALAQARAELVLMAMSDAGYVADADVKAALSSPARVKPASAGGSVGYVADWVARQVPGLAGELRRDVVVETTVEPRLQAVAEAALVAAIDEDGVERRVSEGAVVAMDPDGAVRALVGGRSYIRSQFNRAVDARRQPGSSFKPFVYLAGIEAGLSPETLRNDAPLTIGNWSPGNYSGEYRGAVPLTEALAASVNTVAVRLASEVGIDRVIEAATRLGISSKLESNLSLSLGTSEVSMLEMVAAYAPFANGGYGTEPYVIRRIRTVDGDVLYEREGGAGAGRLLSEEAVGAMNHMMRQTVETGTGRGAAFGGWPAAGKTGTSQEFRDAWFLGYTSNMVAGVWLGNDDNSPTARVTGGNMPARIWREVMDRAHEGVMVADLPGHYVPGERMVVDHSLPWLSGDDMPAHVSHDPSQPLPPSGGGGDGFTIDGGFLKRLFGG